MNGSIDELRIYNRTLNITEINNLYQLRAYHNYTTGDTQNCTNYTTTNNVNLSIVDFIFNNITTADIFPKQNAIFSMGSSILRWLTGWFVNLDVSQNATIGGNVSIANNLQIDGNTNITGNLHINGNFSAKRPYYYGYYNGTDNFINTANAQKMNLTNNNDVDKWLININSSQDITFQQTGDYKCIVSPEFYQNSGGTALATFWMKKNGVDVLWSNSRFSVPNMGYNAPSINFPFDINNTATDYISFYWWSDSTSTQLYSSGALTSPTRPSIPAVLIQCEKLSEITP